MELITGFFTAFFFLVWGIVWLLPILFIAASDKTSAREKVAWILAVVFISWFAWIFYLLLAPIVGKKRFGY
jgi:hypothetical protein